MSSGGNQSLTTPAISILLPTYNGGRFLAEQLDSILQQTWTDFELLMVDDGSADSTGAILADYASKDPRVLLICSAGRRGQKARLEELLHHAHGRWIAISDQDDVWDSNKLERLIRAIGSADLAFGRSELIDEQGHPLNRTLLDVLGADRRKGDRLSILFRPQVSGHAMIARREIVAADIFQSVQPYDWLLSIVAEFSRGVVYDDGAIVLHRMHGSNSHNYNVRARLSIQRLRWGHFRDFITRVPRRRARLIEGMARLAASPVVQSDDRSRFQQLERMCRSAWLEANRKISARELQKSMLQLLRPMAGSERDWSIVVDHVTALTHGMFHPRTLSRLRRLL